MVIKNLVTFYDRCLNLFGALYWRLYVLITQDGAMRQNGPQRRGRGRPSGRRGNNNSPNRSYDSSGPDVKIRGTASTVYEKYSALARDAIVSGDRVSAENFYQHAEHYYRVMQTTRQQRQGSEGEQPENRSRNQQNRDSRNNEDSAETEGDKTVLTEGANVTSKTESGAPNMEVADEIEVSGIELATPGQEEGSPPPMNPAELAAMSASGRKAQNLQKSDGRDDEDVDANDAMPRRQPRRRRAVPGSKAAAPKTISKESETADGTVEDETD